MAGALAVIRYAKIHGTKYSALGRSVRIGAILATLGVSDYNPLLRNRGRGLAELRTALGEPLPANAHAKLKRLLVGIGAHADR